MNDVFFTIALISLLSIHYSTLSTHVVVTLVAEPQLLFEHDITQTTLVLFDTSPTRNTTAIALLGAFGAVLAHRCLTDGTVWLVFGNHDTVAILNLTMHALSFLGGHGVHALSLFGGHGDLKNEQRVYCVTKKP